uniref:Uncharacterized protein n=1 Tax=Mycobacterium phage L1 TaxID=164125 RepID=Q858H5_9VIRU|nr:arginine-rich hypothetical protein [Mycobacterium phage L1]
MPPRPATATGRRPRQRHDNADTGHVVSSLCAARAAGTVQRDQRIAARSALYSHRERAISAARAPICD